MPLVHLMESGVVVVPARTKHPGETMKRIALSLVLVLASAAVALAAAKTGDITVDSQVGKVTNVASGQNAQATANVHSVDVKDGAKTGNITVKGKAGNVTNVASGHNVKSETNIGSVKVGGGGAKPPAAAQPVAP